MASIFLELIKMAVAIKQFPSTLDMDFKKNALAFLTFAGINLIQIYILLPSSFTQNIEVNLIIIFNFYLL